jgi:hypothetical protein
MFGPDDPGGDPFYAIGREDETERSGAYSSMIG